MVLFNLNHYGGTPKTAVPGTGENKGKYGTSEVGIGGLFKCTITKYQHFTDQLRLMWMRRMSLTSLS